MEPRQTSSLHSRARDFALASLGTAYPTEEVAGMLRELRGELHAHAGFAPMLDCLDDGVQALQTIYLERFDKGKERVAMYETEHGRMRGLAKGHDLADIAGFYRAFGFDLEDGAGAEMHDHVAVELEFYSILLAKSEWLEQHQDSEGQSIVEDARRKFLVDHLGRWVSSIARQPAVASDPVYGPLLAWCAGLVAQECTIMAAKPAPLDFFAREDESDCSSCGSVCIPGQDEPASN